MTAAKVNCPDYAQTFFDESIIFGGVMTYIVFCHSLYVPV